jgi:hypothetical protein
MNAGSESRKIYSGSEECRLYRQREFLAGGPYAILGEVRAR